MKPTENYNMKGIMKPRGKNYLHHTLNFCLSSFVPARLKKGRLFFLTESGIGGARLRCNRRLVILLLVEASMHLIRRTLGQLRNIQKIVRIGLKFEMKCSLLRVAAS